MEENLSRKIPTRSQFRTYNKGECFFCQGQIKGQLHACQSRNVGQKIKDIVHYSDNQEWKINYAMVIADSDALMQCCWHYVPQEVHYQAVADFESKKHRGQTSQMLFLWDGVNLTMDNGLLYSLKSHLHQRLSWS